jgi:RNA polymerase-binding transcription factor DksA
MPISGGAANFCCLGADPSKGGKFDMGTDASRGELRPAMWESNRLVTMSNVDSTSQVPDLDHIAQELTDVETALQRLEDGTYFTDEITGATLSDELLASRPTARRA